jgi:heme/copper-type cytochrome/quinol oxidase subunit 1
VSDEDLGGTGPANPRTRRGTWTAVLAMVVGAGMILWVLTRPVGYASFGWFAYAPLSDTTFVPGSSRLVVMWVLFGLGALLVGLGGGFLIGRRRG